jgi:hypothetical protein
MGSESISKRKHDAIVPQTTPADTWTAKLAGKSIHVTFVDREVNYSSKLVPSSEFTEAELAAMGAHNILTSEDDGVAPFLSKAELHGLVARLEEYGYTTEERAKRTAYADLSSITPYYKQFIVKANDIAKAAPIGLCVVCYDTS